MKTIVSKAVHALQFIGIFMLLGGCTSKSDYTIGSVLVKWENSFAQANNNGMSAGAAAAFMATEMQKMDTRRCPPEFRVAFQQHRNAWAEAAQVFSQETSLKKYMEELAVRRPQVPPAAGKVPPAAGKGPPAAGKVPPAAGALPMNAIVINTMIHATYKRMVDIATANGAAAPPLGMNP